MFRFGSVRHTKQTAGTVQCNDMSVQHSTVVVFSVVVLCSLCVLKRYKAATVLRSVA
jgi:hypothetical protein